MNTKEAKQLIEHDFVQDFTDICPHCNTRAHLKMLYNESYTDRESLDQTYYVIFRCWPCKALVLRTYSFKQDRRSVKENLVPDGWIDKFPTEEKMEAKKFDGIINDDILDDYKEGMSNLQNSNLKSAVSMFRRSLQSSLLQLGADSTKDLIDQIRDLPTLTPEIKDWAHNIRIFGNWGSHPQKDNLKGVNRENAEEARLFLEQFFNYVYMMPHKVSKARKSTMPQNQITEE